MELHASSGLTTPCWHQGNGAAGPRQGRSLHRRIVQAVQAGAWRTGKRLRSLVVHACAARARAGRRVTEHTGTKTPGGDNARWETPEKHATAIDRSGPWRGDRPRPLQRLSMPKQHGPPRPLSMPTLEARARHASHRHARHPLADTTADPQASGVRPPRRGAEASAPCCTRFRHPPAATWIVAGERAGCVDHLAVPWLAHPIPLPTRLLSPWLRRGLWDRGTLVPTTAGGPQGGSMSPGISPRGLDGLAAVVHGGHGHRRGHQSTAVRWADDCLVTANARAGFAHTVLPAVRACGAARGVRLSPHKTRRTPRAQGLDC